MYSVIRRYKTSSVHEVVKRIQKEFLSVITSAPGFVAYFVIDESNGIQSSISIFETQAHAEYSSKLASHWVKEHAVFLLGSPEITAGEVVIHVIGDQASTASASQGVNSEASG